MLQVPYSHTGYFSKIILDYLEQSDQLEPFYIHRPNIEGIKEAIDVRKAYNTDRAVLSEALLKQYADTDTSTKAWDNIGLLKNKNTFTVCTAHQPNIFTGHLYFIYKILHAIKLADHLNEQISENHFVPVYYMGSEDADLEELGHVYLDGIKHEWTTKQKGAVGKMLVDDALIETIKRINNQLSGLKFGTEIHDYLLKFYTKGRTIQQATFQFVNEIFKEFGLVILLADLPELKKQMRKVFEDDLLENLPSTIVTLIPVLV